MSRIEKFDEMGPMADDGDPIIERRDIGDIWYFDMRDWDGPNRGEKGVCGAWYIEEDGPSTEMYQVIIPEAELNRAGYFRNDE
jgi:hypothetical protein